MRLHRFGSTLVALAPAKLNLFFEVLSKRSDGFHEVETLVYPIDLFDTLYFQRRCDGRIEFGCRSISQATGLDGPHSADVPSHSGNLAYRAVDLLRRRAGVSHGATLRLIKRIPCEAGLGGGSSDAAAALALANQGWDLGLSIVELQRLGAELGSDVPLFLAGGPSVCRGRGERVEPIATAGTLHFVVVRPPEGLSTAAVYGACRPASRARKLAPLLDAVVKGDPCKAGRSLFNRLESAAGGLSPWIGELRSEFARLDCLGYGMSGSGTCYFGVCRHARHARRVARRLQARRLGVAHVVRGSQ